MIRPIAHSPRKSRSRVAAYDAQIRALIEDGKSNGEIAAALGNGISRGMIAGWRDRKKIKTVRGRGVTLKNKPVVVAPPVKATPEPSYMRQQQMIDGPAPRTCRYIHGEPNGAASDYCGKPVKPESSYCEYHHRVCHVSRKEVLQPAGD